LGALVFQSLALRLKPPEEEPAWLQTEGLYALLQCAQAVDTPAWSGADDTTLEATGSLGRLLAEARARCRTEG
jgi:hypothetical protein